LHGRVVAVDSGSRLLTVAHEDIPGLMSGMTMPFQVARQDDWIFGKIGPGDQLMATLLITDHAELQNVSFTKASDVSGDRTSRLRVPEVGDAVPDFSFVNQAGRTIHFRNFAGEPVLLTFIYTRCPVPDYCILMSSNFREVLAKLQADPAVGGRAQLLSISIDPEHDTPQALREYRRHYTGSVDPDFGRWQFASGSADETRKAADFFGLSYDEKQGKIVHTLRTVLVGGDGRIVKLYSGNQWKPADVAGDYAAAVVGSPPL